MPIIRVDAAADGSVLFQKIEDDSAPLTLLFNEHGSRFIDTAEKKGIAGFLTIPEFSGLLKEASNKNKLSIIPNHQAGITAIIIN